MKERGIWLNVEKWYKGDDLQEIIQMIRETICDDDCSPYSEKQREAWAAGFLDTQGLCERLKKSSTWVVRENGRVIGLGSLYKDVVDLLYVHKYSRRRGVASLLLHKLMEEAVQQRRCLLTTEASFPAVPFFESHGFAAVAEQTKVVRGISIKNVQMCKEWHNEDDPRVKKSIKN